MGDYRIVIDQSTTSTKAILYKQVDDFIKKISRVDKKHKQIYPKKGWVEHDPLEIIDNLKFVIDKVIKDNGLDYSDMQSISITNQRESILVWNKKTLKPYCNIMVWSCNRSKSIIEELKKQDLNNIINQKTGLILDTYFSASKLKWFFDNNKLNENNFDNIAVGTIDTWIINNLSDQHLFVTEDSNACRTMLYNINTKDWDYELLDIFNVPKNSLAKIQNSKSDFGKYKNIPIVSVLADSQSALIGNDCKKKGDIKATLGTGCSIMMNTGDEIISSDKLLSTVALHSDKTIYALEGIIRSFSDILNWEKDSLKLFNTYEEATKCFDEVDNNGVYFIPALEGLSTPYWDFNLKGSFRGMTRDTNYKHLIRSSFESLAYQIKSIVDKFEETEGIIINEINLDGGVTKNKSFLKFLSNLLEKNLVISSNEEASALGTLILLGLKVHNEKKEVIKSEGYNYAKEYLQWENYILGDKNEI